MDIVLHDFNSDNYHKLVVISILDRIKNHFFHYCKRLLFSWWEIYMARTILYNKGSSTVVCSWTKGED